MVTQSFNEIIGIFEHLIESLQDNSTDTEIISMVENAKEAYEDLQLIEEDSDY